MSDIDTPDPTEWERAKAGGRDSNGDALIPGLPITRKQEALDYERDAERNQRAIDMMVEQGTLRPVEQIDSVVDSALSGEQQARADALYHARGVLERGVTSARVTTEDLVNLATFILDGHDE